MDKPERVWRRFELIVQNNEEKEELFLVFAFDQDFLVKISVFECVVAKDIL